jgi:hypothetical protein
MKYKCEEFDYKINITYNTEPEKYIPKLLQLIYIISNNNKYLPLYDCTHCGFDTRYNLTKYITVKNSFIQCSLWIYNIIKKYMIEDCLVFGNSTYFLESLLFYKIKKIGFYPDCIEKKDKENLYHSFYKINKSKKINLEDNTTDCSYQNIILYITIDDYEINLWKPSPDQKDLIYYVFKILKLLKKNGNLFLHLVNNEKQQFDTYTKGLIYIISSSFKYVKYKIPEYNSNGFINKMLVFENYNKNISFLQDIINKLDDSKIINTIIDDYNDNFQYFFKKIKKKIFEKIDKSIKFYNKSIAKFNNNNPIVPLYKVFDNIYKKQYMLHIDKCIYLCNNAQLKVKKKYLIKNSLYKKKLEKFLCVVPNLIKYSSANENIVAQPSLKETYEITIEEFTVLKFYISLKKEKKMNNIIKKTSIFKVLQKEISEIIGYEVSKNFIDIYDLINTFKLINTDKPLETLQTSEDDIIATKHYNTQYNKNNQIKINHKSIDKYEKIIDTYKNIDFCTFDCEKSYDLLIKSVLICIKVLKLEGCGIFRIEITDVMDDKLLSYIKLLSQYFEDIHICRSGIDPFSNNMIYIVVYNKIRSIDDKAYNNIIAHINDNTFPILTILKGSSHQFYVSGLVIRILRNMIKNIYTMLYYCENMDVFLNSTIELGISSHYLIEQYIKQLNIAKI